MGVEMRTAENGFKACCALLLAVAAIPIQAATPFRLELESDKQARVLFLEGDKSQEPQGWTRPGFDDEAWDPPKALASGWLAGSLGLPWLTSGDGRSMGHDRLLVRRAFDLPPGLAGAKGSLQVVVDDNVELFLNGQRFHADETTAFLGTQPRSFELGRHLRPCDNLLALRVWNSNPTVIGFKFRLSITGSESPAARCGSTATFTATRTFTLTPTATALPTAVPTAKPALRPTLKPFVLAKPRVLPSPTPRPTPKAVPRPTLRPALAATKRPTPYLKAAGTPVAKALASAPLPLATPLPWPCGQRTGVPAAKDPARAAAPGARVLAEREAFWVGDGGVDRLGAAQRQGIPAVGCALSLPFHLDAPARVWAEAAKLEGLRVGEVNAAPEVFLADSYLGPLLAEHGGSWRSPQALELPAGDHALLLRCGGVRDAADLRVEGWRVLSDPLPIPATAVVSQGEPCRCGSSEAGRAWPLRLGGKALILSVLSGRVSYSGVLAELGEGQAWECRLRLPSKAGKPLPLARSVQTGPDGLLRVLIAPVPVQPGEVSAVGYTPDAWEPVRIELCGGQLSLRFAQTPELRLPWKVGHVRLELGAQDLEMGIKPAISDGR